MLADVWSWWLSHEFLVWGVGPAFLPGLSYVLTACLLEGLLSVRWGPVRRWVDRHLVEYDFGGGARRGRRDAIEATRAVVPLSTQLWTALSVLFGPTALAGMVVTGLVSPYLIRDRSYLAADGLLPGAWAFVWHTVVMQLVGDLALYWGHRVQHQNAWLWKHCHSVHHALETPTPFGTVYIDGVDALLQAGLPMYVAVVAAQPHPLTAYCYIVARLAENVVNHSGLQSRLVDVLTLKILPGRASIAHHDSHHKFSGFGPKSKNFAENFWFWDWLFGTYRPTVAAKHQ